MNNEVLPPMIKCCECVYSKPFKDMFNGKVRFKCQRMEQIGEFGDFYSIVDSGCTEGIKVENKGLCDIRLM